MTLVTGDIVSMLAAGSAEITKAGYVLKHKGDTTQALTLYTQ